MALIDARTAATMLGCSDQHIYNLIRSGVLTNVGTPRRVRVTTQQINQRLAEGIIRPRPATRPPKLQN